MTGPPRGRRSDRIECLARVLFACALFAVVPITIVAASTAYAQTRAVAVEQAADRQRVRVTVLADAPEPAGEGSSTPQTDRATGVWTDTAGVEHRVHLGIAAGRTAGSTVAIWINREGRETPKPVAASDATGGAVGMGLLAGGGLSALAYGAHRRARAVIDRSRAREWATEWALVEPAWTRTIG